MEERAMSTEPRLFRALGHDVRGLEPGLETFAAPASLTSVEMTSDEVTAVCPVTGQPDFYRVEIAYTPAERCIESKSLKLYLQSFRNEGIFCEDLAARILRDVEAAAAPGQCQVTVIQKARGGITIRAVASSEPQAQEERRR